MTYRRLIVLEITVEQPDSEAHEFVPYSPLRGEVKAPEESLESWQARWDADVKRIQAIRDANRAKVLRAEECVSAAVTASGAHLPDDWKIAGVDSHDCPAGG